MYRLMIVDDDFHARYGLKNYFDWAHYGIQVVGEAENGEVALQLYPLAKPQIVLTDVKMPKMDGIELTKSLHQIDPAIKVVFISGYDDLEYLKSALKVNAIDYIFKSIDLDELATIISRVVTMIREEEQQKTQIYQMEVKIMRSMPYLKENFYETLLEDRKVDTQQIQQSMQFLGISMPLAGHFSLLVLCIDDKAYVYDDLSEKDKQLTSFAILNVCHELIARRFTGDAFRNSKGEFVEILSLCADDKEKDVIGLADEIRDSLKKSLGLSVTIGVGGIVDSIAEIYRSYEDALRALRRKVFLGKNRTILSDNTADETCTDYHVDPQLMEKLTSMLRGADEERIGQLIDNLFDGLIRAQNLKMESIRNICMQLYPIPFHLMEELDLNPRLLDDAGTAFLKRLPNAETVADIRKLMIGYLGVACQLTRSKNGDKSSTIIEKIKMFIQKNYHRDLTVNDIARAVYLTPTYICLIFKQQTGHTINEYLTKVRMEAAQKMLRETNKKLYDICLDVGYTAPSYFTRLFKKCIGLNPTEYRKKAQ